MLGNERKSDLEKTSTKDSFNDESEWWNQIDYGTIEAESQQNENRVSQIARKINIFKYL